MGNNSPYRAFHHVQPQPLNSICKIKNTPRPEGTISSSSSLGFLGGTGGDVARAQILNEGYFLSRYIVAGIFGDIVAIFTVHDRLRILPGF
jgi:hypothetical protein